MTLQRHTYPDYFSAACRELLITANDAQTDAATRALTQSYLLPLGITSMMDVPVRALGNFIGIVCHEHIGVPRKWLMEEQNFASAVATQIALAYERDQARGAQTALLQRTLYDAATGLLNAILLEDTLSQLLINAESTGVILLNIDQYGVLIDSQGQDSVTDLVNVLVSELRTMMPESAFLARKTAERFVLVVQAIAG